MKTALFTFLLVYCFLPALRFYTGSEFNDKEQQICLLSRSLWTLQCSHKRHRLAQLPFCTRTQGTARCVPSTRSSATTMESWPKMCLVFVPGKGFSLTGFESSSHWIHWLVVPGVLTVGCFKSMIGSCYSPGKGKVQISIKFLQKLKRKVTMNFPLTFRGKRNITNEANKQLLT